MLQVKCIWRVWPSVLRERGTACNVSIQNGVTNPKIRRVSYILTRLLCQCPTLLLLRWSISWAMEGKGRGLSRKQFWSMGPPGGAAPERGKKVDVSEAWGEKLQEDPFGMKGDNIRVFYLFLSGNIRKKLSFTNLYKQPSPWMWVTVVSVSWHIADHML